MFYKIDAKCGHVGKNKFIVKSFYVYAKDGKEAAFKVRNYPRVKHHHKNAILNCIKITDAEYLEGRRNNNNDNYFLVMNKQEQLLLCEHIYDEIEYEKVIIKFNKRKNKFLQRHKALKKFLNMSLKEALRYE